MENNGTSHWRLAVELREEIIKRLELDPKGKEAEKVRELFVPFLATLRQNQQEHAHV